MTNSPLGLKLNNPGNIRNSATKYKGEVLNTNSGVMGQFKQFGNYNDEKGNAAWGYRAMAVLLFTYVTKKNLDTLTKILNTYAPAADKNNPTSYAKFVSDNTGVGIGKVLTKADFASQGGKEPVMVGVIRYMTRVEQGKMPVETQLAQGFELFAKDFM